MADRYVQLPNGSYLQWPEGVSAATFKAKATKLMGNSSLPVSTRGPMTMPMPNPMGPKPFTERLMDYIGQSVESTAKLPSELINRSRDIYKQGKQEGGVSGGLKMAEAPFRAEGDILTGLLKSTAGVSTPGIVTRLLNHEDPAKISADAGTFLGGYMLGGPKETSPADMSVKSAAREITDAINPVPKQIPAFQKTVGEHLDKIVTFAKANNIDISSIEGIAQAMKGSGDWIRNHYYNEMLGPVKDRPASIAGTIKGYSGETASPSTATLGQLDARLSQINAELNPKYSKGGIAGQAAVKSATELNAEASGIRKELYGGIAKATGLDPKVVADTRGSFGALEDLAEKTGSAASKERFAANKAERAPLTVNPFSGGKHFIADKAISKLRGDVVGKKLSGAMSKVKVPNYELPRVSPTQVPRGESYNPIRGVSKEFPTFSREDVGAEVKSKLSRRQQANELARKQTEQTRAVRAQRHPYWKFGADDE